MGALSAVQHTMQAQPSHVCGGPGICVCVWAYHHYFNHRLTQATGMCPYSSKASVCVHVCACQTHSYGTFRVPQRNNNNNKNSIHDKRHTQSCPHMSSCSYYTYTNTCTHVHTWTHTFTQPQRGLIMGCERFGVTAYTRTQWHPIQQHSVLSYQSKWISISSTGMRLHATVPS